MIVAISIVGAFAILLSLFVVLLFASNSAETGDYVISIGLVLLVVSLYVLALVK